MSEPEPAPGVEPASEGSHVVGQAPAHVPVQAQGETAPVTATPAADEPAQIAAEAPAPPAIPDVVAPGVPAPGVPAPGVPAPGVPASGVPASGVPASGPGFASGQAQPPQVGHATANYPAPPGYGNTPAGYTTEAMPYGNAPAGYGAPGYGAPGYGAPGYGNTRAFPMQPASGVAPPTAAKRGKAAVVTMSILMAIFLLSTIGMTALFLGSQNQVSKEKKAVASQQAQIAVLQKSVDDTKKQLSDLQSSSSSQIQQLKQDKTTVGKCIDDVETLVNLPDSASNSTFNKDYDKMIRDCVAAKALSG